NLGAGRYSLSHGVVLLGGFSDLPRETTPLHFYSATGTPPIDDRVGTDSGEIERKVAAVERRT
ncbi:MAG: hypothetical protein ABSC16_14770, partial [Candidatus Dormibacteria bacterium]